MRKQVFIVVILVSLLILGLGACKTVSIVPDTAMINQYPSTSFTEMGTVTATATVTVELGGSAFPVVTGDTYKYGFVYGEAYLGVINNMGSVYFSANAPSGSDTFISNGEKALGLFKTPEQKAYHNALYSIIQQVLEKGGDSVANVVTTVDRKYQEKGIKRIETATVTVRATAAKRVEDKKN